MLNPQMKSRGYYDFLFRKAQELKQQAEPEPRKTNWARGSVEWQAEQEAKKKAQIEAAACDRAGGSSLTGSGPEAP